MKLYLKHVSWRDKPDKNEYPFNVAAIKNLEELKLTRPVTFFVGENGIGKSTLLEGIAIASGFNPEGGDKNFGYSIHPTNSQLWHHLRLSRGVERQNDGFFLSAETFSHFATYLEQAAEDPFTQSILRSFNNKIPHKQSHGEGILNVIESRFGGNGLYLLDEPESALSPIRLLELLVKIDELVEKDSQFIITTHSPILLAYPNATIYSFTETEIKEVNYKDTEHYQLTKDFLNNPELFLKNLKINEEKN